MMKGLQDSKSIPGHPKVCFMKVFRYIKPTKKHSFGCLGMLFFVAWRPSSTW